MSVNYQILDLVAWPNDQKDKNDVFCYAEALENRGLGVRAAANGYGIITNGFLWQGHSIWGPDANVGITTTWTNSQFGLFGEYPSTLP